MMVEIDKQTQELVGKGPDLLVCPVGAGSLAQAVVMHYKHMSPSSAVLTVEPDTAACLMASLEAGKIVSITTGDTAMCGLNCGTITFTAWPSLRGGVDAHITVTDDEAKVAEDTLREMGAYIGPCGAATLAGLTNAYKQDKEKIYVNHDSIVVLLGTEAPRGAALGMA